MANGTSLTKVIQVLVALFAASGAVLLIWFAVSYFDDRPEWERLTAGLFLLALGVCGWAWFPELYRRRVADRAAQDKEVCAPGVSYATLAKHVYAHLLTAQPLELSLPAHKVVQVTLIVDFGCNNKP